uniref:Putative ovule protein n=1 Tax=Solanum chacoense TaxID=4108 RepID=A0A0V0HJS9_SOLCH
MVDEFMVCVDRIIIATTCFGDSSVTNGGRETLLTSDAVNVNSTVEIINLRKTHQEKISTSSSSCVGDGGEGSSKGSSSSSSVRECRICQEEDEETDMEAPCACNGTLKVHPFPLALVLLEIFCFNLFGLVWS